VCRDGGDDGAEADSASRGARRGAGPPTACPRSSSSPPARRRAGPRCGPGLGGRPLAATPHRRAGAGAPDGVLPPGNDSARPPRAARDRRRGSETLPSGPLPGVVRRSEVLRTLPHRRHGKQDPRWDPRHLDAELPRGASVRTTAWNGGARAATARSAAGYTAHRTPGRAHAPLSPGTAPDWFAPCSPHTPTSSDDFHVLIRYLSARIRHPHHRVGHRGVSAERPHHVDRRRRDRPARNRRADGDDARQDEGSAGAAGTLNRVAGRSDVVVKP